MSSTGPAAFSCYGCCGARDPGKTNSGRNEPERSSTTPARRPPGRSLGSAMSETPRVSRAPWSSSRPYDSAWRRGSLGYPRKLAEATDDSRIPGAKRTANHKQYPIAIPHAIPQAIAMPELCLDRGYSTGNCIAFHFQFKAIAKLKRPVFP